jgi:hypothetical protein
MRCPKCGFNSFDYLSQCRKCSADLKKTRNELGIPDIQPQMPFLLRPLLKEFSRTEEKGTGTDDALVFQTGNIDLGGAATPGVDGEGTDFVMAVEVPEELPTWSLEDAELSADFIQQPLEFAESSAAAVPESMNDSDEIMYLDPSKDEMVIELSEDDLESLLIQMEASSDDEEM